MKKIGCNQNLSLKNNGKLEIFFIGTGSAFAKAFNQNNFLIIKGNTHIMVDFGMTGPRALYQTAGLEVTDIEAVLPTHSHADHVGGIEALALTNVTQRLFDQVGWEDLAMAMYMFSGGFHGA